MSIILHHHEKWHQTIKDAIEFSEEKLSDDLASYLVFTIKRFIKNPEISQIVFANRILIAKQTTRHQKIQELRDIGDISLLFAGLFPERHKRKRVEEDYFSKIGKTAYMSLSEAISFQPKTSRLFFSLCLHFHSLKRVLLAIRFLDIGTPEAFYIWEKTKNEYAQKALKRKNISLQLISAIKEKAPE